MYKYPYKTFSHQPYITARSSYNYLLEDFTYMKN